MVDKPPEKFPPAVDITVPVWGTFTVFYPWIGLAIAIAGIVGLNR